MDKIVDASRTVMSQNTKSSGEISKPTTVYIWDMDETLILLMTLLDGTYASAYNGLKDTRRGHEIGKHWERQILQVCDELFFYEEIDKYNEPFLDALSEYDDGRDLSNYDFKSDGLASPCDDSNKRKLAFRHRSIAEKYSQGLHKVLDQQMINRWNDLYNLTDSYTDGWLSSAHALLEETLGKTSLAASHLPGGSIATASENINVLVTSGSLIPSLAKCLLYRLDDVISAKNNGLHVCGMVESRMSLVFQSLDLATLLDLVDAVFKFVRPCSWEVGKLQCFSWIKDRFSGPNVRFCAIGDGMEECEAAEAMAWPFIKIDLRPSSPYRFPGLNMKMIQSFIDVIYGSPDDDEEQIVKMPHL